MMPHFTEKKHHQHEVSPSAENSVHPTQEEYLKNLAQPDGELLKHGTKEFLDELGENIEEWVDEIETYDSVIDFIPRLEWVMQRYTEWKNK